MYISEEIKRIVSTYNFSEEEKRKSEIELQKLVDKIIENDRKEQRKVWEKEIK